MKLSHYTVYMIWDFECQISPVVDGHLKCIFFYPFQGGYAWVHLSVRLHKELIHFWDGHDHFFLFLEFFLNDFPPLQDINGVEDFSSTYN